MKTKPQIHAYTSIFHLSACSLKCYILIKMSFTPFIDSFEKWLPLKSAVVRFQCYRLTCFKSIFQCSNACSLQTTAHSPKWWKCGAFSSIEFKQLCTVCRQLYITIENYSIKSTKYQLSSVWIMKKKDALWTESFPYIYVYNAKMLKVNNELSTSAFFLNKI